MFMSSLIYQQHDCTTDLSQINGQLCSDMIGYDTLLATFSQNYLPGKQILWHNV